MKRVGTNQEMAQAKNRELILKILQHRGVCTRVELSRQSGLKQATITNIINDFILWGIVQETGALVGFNGRRSIGIQISDHKYRVIGFRITRQFFYIGIFTLSGSIIGKEIVKQYDTTNPEDILEQASSIINDIIMKDKQNCFLAVGVAVPGPYYRDIGEVAMINNFPGWRNIRIGEVLQRSISIPVIVDHDANAGALAEWTLRIDQSKYESIVYVSVGQGIGAGIVEDGMIYRGSLGIAGEIGHTCVDVNGPLCECGGKGCLTLFASTLALLGGIGAQLECEQDGAKGRTVTMDEAIEMLHGGNPVACSEFKKVMKYIGVAVVNIVFTYNPDLIIIGDEMSKIGQPIIDELTEHLKTLNVQQLADKIHVQLSDLKWDSAFVGAAVLATHYAFEHIDVFNAG